MKFFTGQYSRANDFYRFETNNFNDLGTSYPYISVIKRFEDGREQTIWVIPFSHEAVRIQFCQLIDNSRFVVMSEYGRVKIYDIPNRKQIYHERLNTRFIPSATLSHNRGSLHVYTEDKDFNRQLITVCLETLDVVSTIDLPKLTIGDSLYAREDGGVQISFQSSEMNSDKELCEESWGVYCIDPYTGRAEKYLMDRIFGDHQSRLSVINETLDLMLLPAWKEPEIIVDANGTTSFQTSLSLYQLQTLEHVRTFPVWAIPEQYLSMDEPVDIGIAAGLKRKTKDEPYYEALEQLLSCISNIFPAENPDEALWIQWGEFVYKKFSYDGQALSPHILAGSKDKQTEPFDSVLIEELPSLISREALYEKDGKLYLALAFDGESYEIRYIDLSEVEGVEPDRLVSAIIHVEEPQSVSDDFLPDAVKTEFDRHRVSEVNVSSLHDQGQCLSALDALIDRTGDIEPLRLDDYLVVSIKDDDGYGELREENELFNVAAQHPGGCEKVIQLVENLLAYPRFNELYYTDDTPAFMHAVLALVKHCPEHINTALKYLKRATHDKGSKINDELIPALIRAYQGTKYEEQMSQAVAKTGFSTENLPFIQVLDARVNALLHAPLWEFLECVGGYDDPLFVLAHSESTFRLPDDLPATDETYVKAFWLNDRSAFIICGFSDINDAIEYFDKLPLEIPEFAKVNQITLFRHNPIGQPFETLKKASFIHVKAQAEQGGDRWLIYNDFTDRNSDASWPGIDGYLTHKS
jgi:hypothetical protein